MMVEMLNNEMLNHGSRYLKVSLQIQWISTIDSLPDGDCVLIFMNGRNIIKKKGNFPRINLRFSLLVS